MTASPPASGNDIQPSPKAVFLMGFVVCSLLLLFTGATGKALLPQGKKPNWIWAAAWSPDGKYIALGGDDSTLWLYDGKSFRLQQSFRTNGMIRALAWHPKESLLAIAGMTGVQLLYPKTGQLQTIEQLPTGGRGIGWNYTGEFLALADNNGALHILTKQGLLVRSITKQNTNSYFTLDWHPLKNMVAVAGDEIHLFDISGRQLKMIQHRKKNTGVLTIDWHPSGKFLASGDYGHEEEGIPTLLQFWQEDGTLLKEYTGSRAELRSIRWNRDGTRLATASDALRIWSNEGVLLHEGVSKENIWGLAWSPDGEKLVTGSFRGGHIIVWSKDGKRLFVVN